MSNGKPCTNHNIPENICAACRGAAEERKRIVDKLTEFARIMADDDQPSYMYYVHAVQLINAES
jgi:hypothetical protein